MNRLLSTGFSRLIKNRLFWIGMIFMFGASTLLVLKQYEQHTTYGYDVALEKTLLLYALLIGVVSAIFCSLFLGTEYGDGTIRNKIMIGHSRVSIYVSDLIVNITASLLLCCSYILSNLLLGIPLIGFKTVHTGTFLRMLGGSSIMVVAVCSLYTMICLLVQSKAVAPVICIVAMFLMLGGASELKRMLEAPKKYFDGVPNPNYLTGETREKVQFLYDMLPGGQAFQYAEMDTEHVDEMVAYSTVITVVTTGMGIFFFRKKDIK